jgi:2-methylaconitate cis-trans-isomerase PrpF
MPFDAKRRRSIVTDPREADVGSILGWARRGCSSPYAPFFFVVSPPADYKTINGTIVKAEEIDLVARALSLPSRRR